MDYLEYKQEVKEIAANFRANNPEVARLIRMAKHDLYCGPTYHNADGMCESFDEGATAFDFTGACQKIRKSLDEIGRIEEFQDVWSDADGEWDTVSDFIDGSDDDVKKEIVGAELYKYV